MQGRKIFYIRIVLIIAIILNCVIIFKLSSEKGEVSTARSRGFIGNFIERFSGLDDKIKDDVILKTESTIRKLAHVSIYTSLGFFISAYIVTYGAKTTTIVKYTLIFGIIYASTDEIHQLFISGRSGAIIDVLIDAIGIIIGMLLVIFIKNAIHKKDKIQNEKKKVLFISSTGGHLSELLSLESVFDEYDYYIVTEKTENNMNLKSKYPNRVSYMKYGTKKNIIKYFFIFTLNCIKSFGILFSRTPDVIVTTGAHTAVPMCYIAKILFGKKIIYIETFANVTTKTLTGKLIYPISDVFVVQWEQLKNKYPKSVYWGEIY